MQFLSYTPFSAVVGTVKMKWWKQWQIQYPTEIGLQHHLQWVQSLPGLQLLEKIIGS